MRGLAAAACAAAALAGACAPGRPEPVRPARTSTPPPPSRFATPTPYVTPRPSSQPAPPATASDACGAGAHAYLVGKNRSEIPVPVNPAQRRVYCSTCPVTMDFSASRLNIIYSADNDLITQVKCG